MPHGLQPGRCGHHFRNRIDHNRHRRDVAGNTAGDFHVEVRYTFDVNGIVRLRSPEIRFHVKLDHRRPAAVTDAVLNDAADVTWIDGEILAGDSSECNL